MGNGYPRVPTDGLDELRIALQKQSDRIAELERPTGTQLADAVAQLQAQIANQVTPLVGSNSSSGLSFGTTAATVATLNLTVPDGYTRALVTANGAVAAIPTGSADRIYAIAYIAGVAGAEVLTFADGTYGGAAFATNAQTLTGLTGGSLITVSLTARFLLGSVSLGNSRAGLSATALFLR